MEMAITETELGITPLLKAWTQFALAVKDVPVPKTDIILIQTSPGIEGKMKLGGSMRKKKRKFLKVLHQVPINETIFKDCYPTSVGEMQEVPDSNLVTLDVAFNFEGMVKDACT